MAKSSDKSEPAKDAKQEEAAPAAAAPQKAPAAPQQAQVKVDDSSTISCYANFCRVTGAFEELIVDFGCL